jgi:photosystem II stability/assembly factor-like uncharacterized protein
MRLACFKYLLLYLLIFLFTEVKSQTILSESFEGSFPPVGWTLANTAGNPWTQFSGRAVSGTKSMQCLNNLNTNANAWAFTPMLNLSANTFYRISYWYTALNSERIKITIGNDANIASQTTIIHDYPGIQNVQPLEGVDTISVPLTGKYSIGFNCYSFNNSPGVYMDSIVVQKINPAECTGIPFVGNASGPIAVAPGSTFPLSLSGLYSVYSGIQFQWQSSAKGINNFENISGATTQIFNTSENISQDYRCIVTCSNTGSKAFSNVINVPLTNSGSLFRQKYSGSTDVNKQINGIYFLTPSTGFVAFTDRLGFTKDSGQTYTMRPISSANTDYNGYAVNLAQFTATGVYAFSIDSLLLYGDFGAEPSILFSADQGLHWKLVFHQSFDLDPDIGNSFFDMKFISATKGIALNQKYIVETMDKGQTWTVKSQIYSYSNSKFAKLSVPSASVAYAIAGNSLYKRVNDYWYEVRNVLPPNAGLNFNNISFSSNTTGYISKDDNYAVYKTTNGGNTWTKMNDTAASPVLASDLYFINDSTGFASTKYTYNVLKTTNNGVTWEVCKKNTSYQYENYGMERLFFLNNLTGWAGGQGEYLMLTTSGGSPTFPKAVFKIDTSKLALSGTVNLVNSSNSYYQYKWYKNGVLISSSYNSNYVHDIYDVRDTIMLIASNGSDIDTSVQYQEYSFTHPPLITSFNPASATASTVVTISGFGFTGATSVTFGGVPAISFNVISSTTIKATVPGGLSGDIAITTPIGTGTVNGFIYLMPAAPLITSFYPENGPIGTTVTIAGSNFNNLAAKNVVYFGKMKANVLSSTTSQIVCKVPSGASFDPIIVVNESNNSVGFSVKPFGVTFPGGSNMTPTSFIKKLQLPSDTVISNDIFPVFVTAGDIDGDGRNDVIGAVRYYTVADSIFIYRNTTASDSLSFEGRKSVGTGSNVAVGDIDGDGKLDLVLIDNFNTIGILRNTSTPGNISFAPIIKIALTSSPHDLAISDVDGDGRADIILSGYKNGTMGILQNISTGASISFAPIVEFAANTYAYNLSVGDLNGDSKPDVIIVARSASNVNQHLISIFKNISTSQKISFAPKTDLFIPNQTTVQELPFIVDMNDDNKPDIVLNTGSGTPAKAFVIFKNISTSDSMIFGPELNFSNNTIYKLSTTAEVSNFNGDSLPDLITGNYISNYISNTFDFLKNESVGSTISLNLTNSYGLNGDIWSECGSDLNGDGKPDVIVATAFNNPNGNRGFHIYKNMIGETNSNSVSISASTSDICTSDSVTFTATAAYSGSSIAYQWVLNGMNKGEDSNLYTVDSLHNNDKVYCIITVDSTHTVQSNTIVMSVKPNVNPAIVITTADTTICAGTTATFTATATNGGATPLYQWQLNGVNTGTNSNTFSTAVLTNNDQVKCILTSNAACSLATSVTSNVIDINVTKTAEASAVSINTANSNVCTGDSVTFTAAATNMGNNPKYQWQVNGVNAGSNSNIFTSNTLANGDIVRVILTSSLTCAPQQTVTSNSVSVTVNSAIPAVSISSSSSSVCPGETITFTAIATNGGTTPVYQWKKNGINVGSNSSTYSDNSFINGDSVRVTLISNATCAIPSSANSNDVVVTVAPLSTATIQISGVTLVAQGTSSAILAAITNGGLTPAYQWQDSTGNHSWMNINAATSPTLNYTPSNTGDKLRCLLSINPVCVSATTTISNTLTFTLSEGGTRIYLYPNPVTSKLTIDSLNIADEWQTLTIINTEGTSTYFSNNIKGQLKIELDVTNLPSGSYIGILRNKKDKVVFFKFVKI